mgnify:CR=1 FL=1
MAIALTLLGVATIALALRAGLVPDPVARLFPLDLSLRTQSMQDWRISALTGDRELCEQVLAVPGVSTKAVDDRTGENGCGWANARRLDSIAEVRIGAEPLTCPATAALALWLTHVVQPAAQSLLGQGVRKLTTLGTYSCRGMIGDRTSERMKKLGLRPPLSEHAHANAIDVAAFVLEDGSSVTVLTDWDGDSAKARFLRTIHDGACRYFHVTLGPAANAEHRNHFHLDRGLWHACR